VKIERVEIVQGFKLPMLREHTWVGGGSTKLGAFLIIKLYAADRVGLGEAPALIEWGGDFGRYSGESPKTAAHVIGDFLLPAIVGEDAMNLGLIHQKMDRVVKGHFYAKAAIDMACYDLAGKALNLPAYALMGGCFRKEIRLVHSFGVFLTPDYAEREAETVLAEGIKTLKLRVGYDADRDVEVVKRFRKLGGPDIEIYVDANMGWPDPKTAVRVIERLDEHHISFVEQPVEGIDRMAEVRRHVRTRIMADESAWSPHDVYEIARKEAADLISISTAKPGGVYKALKVAAVCEAVGLRANLNGQGETGVGNAANLHLAAASKIVDLACDVGVSAPAGRAPTKMASIFYTDDIVAEPYQYRDGHVLLPDGPGLGIELDDEKVEKYRVHQSGTSVARSRH
jgi:muconate cycloisomerase